MAKIKQNANGGIDIQDAVTPERMKLVAHLFADPQAVVDELEKELRARHTDECYKDALEVFKASHDAGETGQPANPFDKDALIAWHQARADYETRPAKEARIEAQKQQEILQATQDAAQAEADLNA